MIEDQHVLTLSERFPKEMEAPGRADILIELSKFGIGSANTIQLIDTTHDARDVRLNYIIDKKWVLRFCNAPDMAEKRMGELNRLIGRYRAMGFLCPAFIADDNGKYLHPWKQFLCYLSEYIDRPLASDTELNYEEQLTFQVAENVARFAETYRDADLSETMGMYSLFELSPFDVPNGVDEKQDNFNKLIRLLRNEEENDLAARLEIRHADTRCKLKAVFRELPRCVFQGDENFSNVLIDDAQHFVGFIDFNLAGTEVIINQLVNLEYFKHSNAGRLNTLQEEINHSTELIQAINDNTSHLKTIANRQKILSLNASIEAARSGEAGVGFAVVAKSMQDLSSQSAVIYNDIEKSVAEITKSTSKLSALFEEGSL